MAKSVKVAQHALATGGALTPLDVRSSRWWMNFAGPTVYYLWAEADTAIRITILDVVIRQIWPMFFAPSGLLVFGSLYTRAVLNSLSECTLASISAACGKSIHKKAKMTSLVGLASVFKKLYVRLLRASNLADRYRFDDRRTGSDCVVIVLSGYKQPLWPDVFPRLARAIPERADVCIMSAGKYDAWLDGLAAKNGWSYLSSKTNDVSLVQNIAINLHPQAVTIIKLDEDIFLTENTLRDTLTFHREIIDGGIVEPCFTAPLLNVNGVCYRPLLKQLGLLSAYESQFGTAKCATLGIRATDDVLAARWLWKHTAPLESTVLRLKRTSEPELMASVQFSIGVIVFQRYVWDQMNYFPVNRLQLALGKSTLGVDEEYICRMAMFYARPIVICQHALAGHFSFGRQYKGMLELLKENPEYFAA